MHRVCSPRQAKVVPMTTTDLTRDAAPTAEPSATHPSAADSSVADSSAADPPSAKPPVVAADAAAKPRDPRWARPAFILLLLGTFASYCWGLQQNGWANSFYAAAAQAGSENWTAFLFGSLDPSNAITVDKPPASLWVMALSIRLFGLNTWALLLPEVLMGVASVALVYATVRRHFGALAGLIAGLALATTPVAVLMFRFDNPDALLVLLMTAATWATLRAIDQGRYRWFVFAGAMLGFGFLTKTLQVGLVIPFLGVAWLVCARTSLPRRIRGALAGVLAFVVSAGWWVAIVELVPESWRPYVGGSEHNSFLELTFGYNGIARLTGNGNGGGPGGGGSMWGSTGITRLFSTDVGGQISWLIPAALLLLVAGLWFRGRAPRTDAHRAAYLAWGGWLVVTGLTFSFMEGTFHQYYTVALAPAVAALVGMGAAEAWERRSSWLGRGILAATVAATAGWSWVLLSRTTEYGPLRWIVLAAGLIVAAGLLGIHRLPAMLVRAIVVGAVLVGLAGPTAYSITTVTTPHTGSIVLAGPSTGNGMGGGGGQMPGGRFGGQSTQNGQPPQGNPPSFGGQTTQDGTATQDGQNNQSGRQFTGRGMGGGMGDAASTSTDVIAALQANASSYRWVVATIGSQSAASLQLAANEPVMAIGGFTGSDPSPTLAQFKAYVAAGEIHYFAAGGGGGGRGGSGSSSEITSWVEANFTKVTIGGSTFYDLTKPVTS